MYYVTKIFSDSGNVLKKELWIAPAEAEEAVADE